LPWDHICGGEESLAGAVSGGVSSPTRYWLEPNPRPLASLLRHSSPSQAQIEFDFILMSKWQVHNRSRRLILTSLVQQFTFQTSPCNVMVSGVAVLFFRSLWFFSRMKRSTILFLHVKQPYPNIIGRSRAATNKWTHVDVFRNCDLACLAKRSMTRFIRSLFADDST
jgi:hypothetical protein